MSESNDNSQQSVRLSNELAGLCKSALISEDDLRELIEGYELKPNNRNYLDNYEFFLVACYNKRVTEGIIQCLLEYFPDAASASKSEDGMTPLHVACGNKNNATLNIIRLLLNAAPDSIRSVNNGGNTPLHSFCCNHQLYEMVAIEILMFLLEKYPGAVQHTNKRGHLPIHLASRGRSPGFCHVLIEAYPGSELISDAKGALPLHHACGRGSLATAEYLFRLNSDAIHQATTKGQYPIHAAINSLNGKYNAAAAVEIVRFLLDCDPVQKLKQFQGKWSLLQYACQVEFNESNIEAGIQMVKVILDAHPASVRSVDRFGNTPLHLLCFNGRADETVAMQILNLLIEKYPEAVRHANVLGNLPIHLAAETKSPDFCRVLINAYPGSERMNNTDGELPLHCASLKGSLATVEYLYGIYPDAIHASTGGLYPIHKTISGTTRRENPAAAVDIVQFLLVSDPNQKLKQFQGKSLLRYACEMDYNNSNIEAAIQMIKIIFDVHPEAIKHRKIAKTINRYHNEVKEFINAELAHTRQAKDRRLMTTPDDNGQLPLHTALQNNVRLGSIKLLVKGNPSALRTLENNFALPLHLACQHHDCASVVQYLLGLDNAALEIADRQGNTALHCACRGAKYDTIAMLLEKYDAASVSKRNSHDKLPIDLLWESEASDRESVEYMGSVFQLMRAYPEMVAISSSLTVRQPVDADASRNGKKRKNCHDSEE